MQTSQSETSDFVLRFRICQCAHPLRKAANSRALLEESAMPLATMGRHARHVGF